MNRRQTIPAHLRYTFQQFDKDFPNDDACLEQVKEQRFPGGVTDCHKCNQKPKKHYRVKGRTAYACETCGNHIYPLAGTIFEKSSTPLRIWFHAMYLIGSTRCGISAKQIQRETGVTYKTAWRMFKQIRKLMAEEIQLGGPESGGVEIDEGYIGGRRKSETDRQMRSGMHSHLSVVGGIVERDGGRIVARVGEMTKPAVRALVKEFVLPETIIFTDDAGAFQGLGTLTEKYQHRRVSHTQKVWVSGDVHTNTIDGFWSLVKRGIGGVYHSVSAKYLQSYLDEYSFRYNRREFGNLIFPALLQRASEMVSHKPALKA